MSARGPYTRLSHNISPDNPFRLKHDHWMQTGPGLRDMHYEVELGIVRSGKMRREFGGKTRLYKAGELWLHGIWEPHSAEVLQAPLDLIVIHIDPATLAEQFFRESPECNWLAPFTLPAEDRPQGKLIPTRQLNAYLTDVDALTTSHDRLNNIRLRLITCRILLDIIDNMAKSKGMNRGREDRRWQHNLEKILSTVFIDKDWAPAGEVAKKFGMSRNGFNNHFQGLMGISYAQFVLHHRLSGAAGDLAAGEKPIKVIAQDWGFCDISHFYRRFLEVYSCTPIQFRSNCVL